MGIKRLNVVNKPYIIPHMLSSKSKIPGVNSLTPTYLSHISALDRFSDLEKAKNREKQRRWRENNRERSRELKRISNWRARGITEKTIAQRLKNPPQKRLVRTSTIPTWAERVNPKDEIQVSLCNTCFRKYLTRLHCLFCTKYNL